MLSNRKERDQQVDWGARRIPPCVLATDLDGTLIPLDESSQLALRTLKGELAQNNVTLVFVTGRHFESVRQAIQQFELPEPEWIICDVGTAIFQRRSAGEFEAVTDYQRHLAQIVDSLPVPMLRTQLQSIDGLRLQEERKQGPFKLSFYADAIRLDDLVRQIEQKLEESRAPYSIVPSVDPFNNEGLIDLLPANVSKAYAVKWWCEHRQISQASIVFAGDSGNDLAALTAGYRTIVVGNADRALARQVEQSHRQSRWENRLYLARDNSTGGVLAGCRWFGLIAATAASSEKLGATPLTAERTHFRVWAPARRQVEVELRQDKSVKRHALRRVDDGYFCGTLSHAGTGTLYRYVLDNVKACPDPASRFQPEGVHGASQVVDADAFAWSDQAWQGVEKRELVIYEMHIGALTHQGTLCAAIEQLDDLVRLGITAIELMPVAQSPGRRNWGYDGVGLFAVRNTYGTPDDLKAFVDACHAKGLAVILDVVYNHLGPEGNYLAEFGPYFSRKHHTPWGPALNFDGRRSEPVRRFIVDNAIYWLEEYHLDGLRLDAVHFMHDDSTPSILDDIRQAVSAYSQSSGRILHLIAETNVFEPELLAAKETRPPYDAIWCDCLMHSIYSHGVPKLSLTHRGYQGASDVAEALRWGYIYAGRDCKQTSVETRRRLHESDGCSHIASLVTALQNHDAVGNHPHGMRIHQLTSKSYQKAAAALVLLYPSVPLIFMGEEYACDAPFPFFTDFEDAGLRKAVDRGRAREYRQHDWKNAPRPSDPQTFRRAKCQGHSRDPDVLAWYQSLLRLRKQGIRDGWLSTERMTCRHDDERGIFFLEFADNNSGGIVVQVRLTAAETSHTPFLKDVLRGDLLLSSEPGIEAEDGHVLLKPNHAVISK